MCKDKSANTDDRIMDLETRLAFQDDLIEELNGIVGKQQIQLDRLEASLNVIAEKLKGAESQGGSFTENQQEESPPHY